MVINLNYSFARNAKKVNLGILNAGYGELQSDWEGEVINSPYSRFYIVLEGEFYIVTDSGERFEFKKGNAYLVPSGFSYRYGCDLFMKHIYFHIQLCGFDKIDLLGDIPSPITIPFNSIYTDAELVSFTLSENFSNSFIMETELRKTLCDMLNKNGIALIENEYSPEIKSAINYISDNLSIELGIEKIAKEIGFAQSTLTRRFKKETGMSVGEYIDNLIMFRTERALLSTSASILEISEGFGFCDQFYFSRRFKEKYGVSPREYRKKRTV